MQKPTKPIDDLIREQLKDPALAIAYLNEVGVTLTKGNQEDVKHLMLVLYRISLAQGKDELSMVPYIPDFIKTLARLGIVMQFKYLVDCVHTEEQNQPKNN